MFQEQGNNVKIRWYYLEDDEDMLEMGEDYADLVNNIEIELIPYLP